jgi:tetratricopeptide (TPR) repeat protein
MRGEPGAGKSRRGDTAGAPARRAGPRGLAAAAAVLLVAAIVAWAHWPVLGTQATSLDDDLYVASNPLVTHPSWTSTRRFFSEVLNPSSVAGYYHPLAMTSLMLDYAAGGRPEDLRVFHRTNLALHVLSAMVIVVLLFRLFGALVPAALAGLLFALHPLTVEPLAWVEERKTLLSACFAFACLLAYVEHARRGRRIWLTTSGALYVLALLSKPTVTMLPLLLLLLDWWPLKRLRWRTVFEKWPFFLLSAVFGVITLVSQRLSSGLVPTTPEDLLRWPLRVGCQLAFYLGKLLRPTDLSCVYPLPEPMSLTTPAVLWSVVLAGALTLLLVAAARRARGPLAGWLFFVLAIAPTMGIVKYSWVTSQDKYVYLPALGFVLVLGSGLTALWDSKRWSGGGVKAVLVALALLVLAAEARGVRNALGNWRDSVTLWRHIVTVAPGAPAAQNGLGAALARKGRADEAVPHFREAVRLGPDFADARLNLGLALLGEGDVAEATRCFRTVVAQHPGNYLAHFNLGLAELRAGRPNEAEAEFRSTSSLKPRYVEAMDMTGYVLVLQGRPAEGLPLLRRAVSLAPTYPHARFSLAMALLRLGGHDAEAVEELRQAVRFNPAWADPYNQLAWLLATSADLAVRNGGEALRLADRAVELSGNRDPNMLDTQAAAQAAAGQFDQAAQTARRAIEVAVQSRADSLVPAIRARMRLYEQRTAYTEKAEVTPSPHAR